MPVCARCFGIYLGLAAGLLIFLAGYRFLQHPMPLPALAGCILPLALDGTTQALLLRESTNSLRLATGVLAGTGFLLWALIHIELNGRRNVNRLKFETVRAAEDS